MYDQSTGGLSDPALWVRIRAASLPASRDGRDFAQLLAHLADLPQVEAREVELEYRRFLYLVAIDEGVRVPPPQLNTAWQLHAQSPDYEAFCTEILGKPLLNDDAARRLGVASAYARTLKDYAREFGERPPRLIWSKGVAPRLPRWLWAHSAVWGAGIYVALGRGEPLVLALALGLSLGLYGLDLWGSARARHRAGLRDTLSDDLQFFLNAPGR